MCTYGIMHRFTLLLMCLQVAVFVILPPGEVWGVYEQSTYLGDRGKKRRYVHPNEHYSLIFLLLHMHELSFHFNRRENNDFRVVGKGIIISNVIVILQYFTPLACRI